MREVVLRPRPVDPTHEEEEGNVKQVRRLRPFVLICALLLAMVPVAASAKVKATPEQEAANRAARCGMVLSGAKIPGKLTASQCGATGTGYVAGVEVRALASLPGAVPLTPKQQAEWANKAARCALVLSGQKVSGKLTAAECAAFAKPATGSEVRALGKLPAAKCPVAPGASLNKVQQDLVNNFAVAKAKAESKHKADPAPSEEVAALLAC